MFNWLEHDKKISTPETFTYKELRTIHRLLAQQLERVKEWKTSKDPVDKKDYSDLDKLSNKIFSLMYKIDKENSVEKI